MTTLLVQKTTERTMHIGELAEATGLSLRTIRHYDEIGLLPAFARTDGGYRVYTHTDLDRLLVIRSMKPLGFTLEDMTELLTIVDKLSENPSDKPARALLEGYIQNAQRRRDKLALNLERANQFISELSDK